MRCVGLSWSQGMSCSRKGQDSLPLLPPLRLSALAWGGPQQASTGDRCLLKSMTFDIVCYFGNVNSWNTDTQSCQHPDIQNHNWVFCRSSFSQASPSAAQTLSGSRCCQEEPPTLLPQRGEPVSFWAFRQVTPKLPCFFKINLKHSNCNLHGALSWICYLDEVKLP